jgi:two-component system response regulator WspF
MRIAIVNDLRAACEALKRVVGSLPDHQLAWTASDGVEAIAMARRDRPDLILMDLLMPHMDGAQATRQIMSIAPCAILVVTATVSGNISLVYDAMGYGALDAVDTPMLGPAGEVSGAGALVEKIGTIAKLVGATTDPQRVRRAVPGATPPRLLVVGASTGGPKAVSDLIFPLPHDWNVAVVVVQHVDVAFAPGLAKWLGDRTGRPVRVAEHGEEPLAGDVLLAGTNDHLVLTKSRALEYRQEPRDVFFRPSVDVFFESVAEHWPRRRQGAPQAAEPRLAYDRPGRSLERRLQHAEGRHRRGRRLRSAGHHRDAQGDRGSPGHVEPARRAGFSVVRRAA